MALGRKIAYNVVVSTGVKIASTALALVGIGMVMQYLGQGGFGAYATALAYFALFTAIADFGLYHIMTREIGRPDADESYIVRRIFMLRLIISGSVLTFAMIITWFLPYDHTVKIAIILVAIAFLFSSSYSLLNGVFQKHLAMDRVAITEFFGKAAQVLWFVGVIHYDGGLLWIVGGVIVAMVVNCSVLVFLARRYTVITPTVDRVYWRSFLQQSIPMGVAAIITFLYFKVDTLLLSLWTTPADVGIYSAAYKIMENLIFFPALVMGLMLPILSRTIFTDKKVFREFANKTLKVFFLLIVPIVVGVMFTATEIMDIVGGGAYTESALILQILIVALFFIFFGQFFTTILLVGNLQKTLMYALGVAAIVNIAGNAFAINQWSYLGAASMSVITESLVVGLTSWLVWRKLHYIPHIPQGLRILGAGAIMTLVLILIPPMSFILTVFIAGIAYVGALALLRAVSITELSGILSRKN